jgi:arylsulfatase A-like enzyme
MPNEEMKLQLTVKVISAGVILGFLSGLIIVIKRLSLSFDQIATQPFIKKKIFSVLALVFRDVSAEWIVITVIISVAVVIGWFLGRLLFSELIQTHILNEKFNKRFVYFVCSLFLVLAVLSANCYSAFSPFKPVNLAADVLIILFTAFLGWLLIKVKWEVVSFALIGILIILRLGYIGAQKPANVVLIVIDTLRADHMSCHGYSRKTTRNIDKFAHDSVFFKNAISQAPWTTPSIGSIITSQYPSVLGIEESPVKIDDRFITIAEIFKENGYITQGIISHSYLSSGLGFDQGFDAYDQENSKGGTHISSPSVTQKAISFVKEHKDKNFFLFLHYFDPHRDFFMHDEFNYFRDYKGGLYSGQSCGELRKLAPKMSSDDMKYMLALYDSEISFTDKYIGHFFDELKKLGLYDNSLIILTADHGGEFCERPGFWIGHTKTLYQEQIHVPLIIKLPEKSIKKTIEEYVGLIDLMPTILNLSGLKIPDEYSYDGIVIDLNDEKKLRNRNIFSETKRVKKLQCVIKDGWKLIRYMKLQNQELYDLENDLAELKDLTRQDEEKLSEMNSYLIDWNLNIKSKKSLTKALKPKFTEEERRHLRSLGYLN